MNLTDSTGTTAARNGRTQSSLLTTRSSTGSGLTLGGIASGLKNLFVDPLAKQMTAIKQASAAAHARWETLDTHTRGLYVNREHYAAAQASLVIPDAAKGWWVDKVINPITSKSISTPYSSGVSSAFSSYPPSVTGVGGKSFSASLWIDPALLAGSSEEAAELVALEKAVQYFKRSAKQLILGNYTEEVTVLGTAAQVGVGATGIDFVADLRDVTYDLTHWQWSWGHAGQTLLDVVGLVPVIGVVKNLDEAATLVKGIKKVEKHHELPKQFETIFKKAGLDIEDYVVEMEKGAHRLKPGGLHTGPENWNKQWREFFEKSETLPTKEQILEQLDKMRKEKGQ